MNSQNYGYARVSTREQNESRQIEALETCGIALKRIYIDKQSGKDFNRPEYRKMIRDLRKGDNAWLICVILAFLVIPIDVIRKIVMKNNSITNR